MFPGDTGMFPDVPLLHSSSFSWGAVGHSQTGQPLNCHPCGKYDVGSEVAARCYRSACFCCLPGFLPWWEISVTESSLAVRLLHQCSGAFQSAAFPFHSIRRELLPAPLELFHSLIHLRITKCCRIILFKCFLCLVSPFHLPIFHALSLETFCPSSNFHPQSHPHQISILWWYSKSVNIF